jgi:hypothetical protein
VVERCEILTKGDSADLPCGLCFGGLLFGLVNDTLLPLCNQSPAPLKKLGCSLVHRWLCFLQLLDLLCDACADQNFDCRDRPFQQIENLHDTQVPTNTIHIPPSNQIAVKCPATYQLQRNVMRSVLHRGDETTTRVKRYLNAVRGLPHDLNLNWIE